VVADAFINCRVTSEIKARVRALAERQGTNESAIIKQLLHEALRSFAPCAESSRIAPPRVARRERVCVRIGSEDRRRLKERAASRGLASGTYVALLVRTHLSGRAPVPKAEYLALRQCMFELTAIGRNLNQIAKALNQGDEVPLPGKAEVAAMLKVAESLRDHVSQLLKTNQASWHSHATTAH
jgi:predicted DNA binding CopG/RHH family protein